jgi:anti-sigma B factor antagonist
VSDTAELLRTTVKPLFSESKTVVLDLTDVNYIDSSGLGTLVGLYVSAKAANRQLKLINLNQRLKELFSITRLGEVMAQGRDPDYLCPEQRAAPACLEFTYSVNPGTSLP